MECWGGWERSKKITDREPHPDSRLLLSENALPRYPHSRSSFCCCEVQYETK